MANIIWAKNHGVTLSAMETFVPQPFQYVVSYLMHWLKSVTDQEKKSNTTKRKGVTKAGENPCPSPIPIVIKGWILLWDISYPIIVSFPRGHLNWPWFRLRDKHGWSVYQPSYHHQFCDGLGHENTMDYFTNLLISYIWDTVSTEWYNRHGRSYFRKINLSQF